MTFPPPPAWPPAPGQPPPRRSSPLVPLLIVGAIAVRKWEYEPTRLNGVAVPVIMTVTVNFTLR